VSHTDGIATVVGIWKPHGIMSRLPGNKTRLYNLPVFKYSKKPALHPSLLVSIICIQKYLDLRSLSEGQGFSLICSIGQFCGALPRAKRYQVITQTCHNFLEKLEKLLW
jgi:hypothetical protein